MKNLILTEIKLKSTDWANVSDKRLNRNQVTISRGKAASSSQASPSQANVTLNNTGGLFSPRNPQSSIYGQIGRNTPIRISVARGAYGMVTSGVDVTGGGSFSNDQASYDITGDIDIRVDLEVLQQNTPTEVLSTWTGLNADWDIASKLNDNDAARSWSLYMVNGSLRLDWFELGTVASRKRVDSIALTGAAQGRRAVRVTLDVDNGAAGNTVTFYTAPTIAGPWTVLGAPIVTAAVTSIFSGNAPLRIGGALNSSTSAWGDAAHATFYSAEIRNGINGTVVASPNFTAQVLDPVPFSSADFTDAQGNTWRWQGTPDAARIWYGDVSIRFVGEIAELPPRWDESHRDKYVPIVANGILRRLGRGKAPVASGLRDFILRPDLVDALAAYYPLSGAEGTLYSLNIAPINYYLQTRFFGQAVIAQVPVFTYGKDMGAPWLGSGMELNATGNAYMRGDVATADQNCALDFVWQSPALGVLTVQIQDYNVNIWDVTLDTSTNDGTLQVHFTDQAVGPIGFLTVGPFIELQDTAVHHLRFQLTTVGADTQFAVYIDGTLRSSGTMTGYTLNGVALTRFFYSRFVNQTVMNIAHIAVWANANAAQIPPIADTVAAAFGYVGETAGARITRLCDDGGIPLVVIGDPADTTAMGAQFAEPRLAQIRDAEATDFGILTEQRADNGLLYRTRASQYAQTPAFTVDYSAKVVAPPFEPTDDDQDTRNDVTATRRDGGSVQLTLKSGAMSVLDPPAGIGQYEDEVTVNVQTDDQLIGVASWVLNEGTLDAARYPSVTFNLAAAAIDDTLRKQILALEVGDRLPIANIDAADIPDDVDLIVLGYTETLDNATWSITFNCAPGQPYAVARYGTARYDADGSLLTAGITTTALSLQATKSGTSLWTTDPAAFPFDINIGGERMTVSNITGATSPQTITLSARAVNGVVKAHSANEPIRLWDTPRYAL